MMTTQEKLALMKMRLEKLKASPKNIKCPGVVRALEREIRNLQREAG